jgi:hypothetical protein
MVEIHRNPRTASVRSSGDPGESPVPPRERKQRDSGWLRWGIVAFVVAAFGFGLTIVLLGGLG